MNSGAANESVQEIYLRVWKSAAKALLNWDADRVQCWALQRFGTEYNDSNSLIYHATALGWLIPLFIPERIDIRTMHKLRARLEDAICAGKYEEDPSLDWDAARKRVEDMLKDYDVSLTSICSELDNNLVGLGDSAG